MRSLSYCIYTVIIKQLNVFNHWCCQLSSFERAFYTRNSALTNKINFTIQKKNYVHPLNKLYIYSEHVIIIVAIPEMMQDRKYIYYIFPYFNKILETDWFVSGIQIHLDCSDFT